MQVTMQVLAVYLQEEHLRQEEAVIIIQVQHHLHLIRVDILQEEPIHPAQTEVVEPDHQVREVITAEALHQTDHTTTAVRQAADHTIPADHLLIAAGVLHPEDHLTEEVAAAEVHQEVAEVAVAAAVDNLLGEL